ncbi:MAG: hypothetical protein H6672_18085 [Anaerolineaceae bacterium]|nr:hypothetical protein [Anaerolineaceae bacterium]
MAYWDEDQIRKRLTRRYARRFVYLGSLLVFLLIFGITWRSGDVISTLVNYTRPNGEIIYMDGTPYYLLALLLIIWPIAHTVYLLYQEVLERALDRELAKATLFTAQQSLDDDNEHLVTDDNWIQEEMVEKPKRHAS